MSKEQPTQQQPRFIRSPSFLAFYQEMEPHIKKLRVPMNEKKYTLKNTEINHRTLNHWTGIGIIPNTRADGSTGWHRLSITDLLWLEIIEELRGFGLSLDKIRTAYQSLFFDDGKPSHFLETAMVFGYARMNIFVAVMADGTAGLVTDYCLEHTDEAFNYPSYVRISLNALLQKIYPEAINSETIDRKLRGYDLTPDEIEVLKTMRGEQNGEVQVVIREGEITRFNIKKKADPKQRVAEMLQEMSNGEIHLKVEKGKIVDSEVTKKKRKKC